MGVRYDFTDMGLERVSTKANLSSFSSKFIYNNHVFKCLFPPAFAPCVLAKARFSSVSSLYLSQSLIHTESSVKVC